jgi:hypothetical protein
MISFKENGMIIKTCYLLSLLIFIPKYSLLKKKESTFIIYLSDLKKYSKFYQLIWEIELPLNVVATIKNLWSSSKLSQNLKDTSKPTLEKNYILRVLKNSKKIENKCTSLNHNKDYKKKLSKPAKLEFRHNQCLNYQLSINNSW